MRAWLPIVLTLGSLGCGPSIRMVHESTVYFERCHAAELEDDVSLELKIDCWNRWLRWYSGSQAQTRVLYARERVVYLSQGELVDPLPTGESAIAEIGTPLPAQTPERDSVPPPSSNAPLRPRNPRATGHTVCEPVCRPNWESCTNRCDGYERNCLSACQTEYAACMSGCI